MTENARSRLSSWQERLSEPCDAASLSVFRMAVGLLLAVSSVRFVAEGWVERFFFQRSYFFHYPGFEWVSPWPRWGMYAHFAAMVVCALSLAAGFYTRLSAALLFLLFTYVELLDVTNYLNHYYLVSLLLLWLTLLPARGAFSVDGLRDPSLRAPTVPAWVLWTLRTQVALVYVHAGLAKLGTDWLVHGQPLNLWLNARRDLPLVGDYLGHPYLALAVGWAGMLHDLCVVPLLLYRPTRVFGYLWLLTFHFGTHLLFYIGIFPVLMPLSATLFFDPGWPRRLFRGARALRVSWPWALTVKPEGVATAAHASSPRSTPRLPGWAAACLVAALGFQVFFPLRAHFYAGNLLWTELGMRWSWRVMVREKQGDIVYRATLPSGRVVDIPPRRYLSAAQDREMSGQPDMILQLGRHIGRELSEREGAQVPVRVDAMVSLNGRRQARLVDPSLDVTQTSLRLVDWILPAPTDPPPQLGRKRMVLLDESTQK